MLIDEQIQNSPKKDNTKHEDKKSISIIKLWSQFPSTVNLNCNKTKYIPKITHLKQKKCLSGHLELGTKNWRKNANLSSIYALGQVW